MLAQNFKTPAELSLTSKQFDAAVLFLGMLERNEVHHSAYSPARDKSSETFTGHFNMACWNADRGNYGTVCCIGGSIELLSGEPFHKVPEELIKLFYPTGYRGWLGYMAPRDFPRLWDITPAQAAIALRSYLTTGKANWREAVKA